MRPLCRPVLPPCGINSILRMRSVLYQPVLLGLLLCAALLSPTMPPPDQYPGDASFTQIIQDLRAAAQNDTMNFPWAGRSGMTRRQLCQTLVDQHLDGRNNGMAQANAAWVNGPALTRRQLETACLDALTNPRGFASAAGWNVWQSCRRIPNRPSRCPRETPCT